jgi:hypothetical protein
MLDVEKTSFYFDALISKSIESSRVSDDEEDLESQSGYSILSTNGTVTSNKSTLSKTNSTIAFTQGKRDSKQRHVSIGPTSIAEISPSNGTDHTKTSATTISSNTEINNDCPNPIDSDQLPAYLE